MAASERLIIGLGNPGAEYAGTRHNIGFEVIDLLAERLKVALEGDRNRYLSAQGKWRGRPLRLLKPMQYMNLSGETIAPVVRRSGLDPQDLLVVLDDINLPTGAVRIRPGGSAGGHNGLQDIIDHLGSDAVPRIRIGVGNDFSKGRQAQYVLSRFSAEERTLMDDTVRQAAEAVLTFVVEGITTTMNRFNKR